MNNNKNLTYCWQCTRCQDCFGCVGLKNEKFCVFNKKYSEEEYKKITEKIIKHMETTGEWGEFFPATISPHEYNITVAQEYYPLTKEQALAKNYKWRDNSETAEKKSATDGACACENCKKSFRILKVESEFYKKQNLPEPRVCFFCRRKTRFEKRNKRILCQRECDNCHEKLLSTFPQGCREIIYCEECYQKSLV